ncbi:alpha-hydroxy-acid oxidizing protein [Rhodobacterales bacterium HKCCE2091]|nr:alpha-hydroxy-acid oxidizing protein [Rhodobacterales bacterium HKCCE2091]
MSGTPFTIAEYEARARDLLPDAAFNTLFGTEGGRTWRTNSANIAAFDALPLRPRVMAGIAERRLATTVLGQEIALPVMAAPSGSHQRVHSEGEVATARGTHAAGSVMILSTISNFSIEEVAAAGEGPNWFQCYVLRDREMTADLVRRAEAAGYGAVVLTVDNIAGRLGGQERLRLYRYSWATEVETSKTLERDRILRNFAAYRGDRHFERQSLIEHFDAALGWDDLDWLRSVTSLPIVIKGIQTAEDAIRAADHGAAAVVVSNHGGTIAELDGQPGSLLALPEVVAAVGGRIEVYVDGGIRRGKDVLKALALGAQAVLIGRAVQWGLAVDGSDGVAEVFAILRRELDSAMGLCGVADVRDVPRGLVGPLPGGSLAADLERLAALHATGHLTEAEFSTAKDRVLRS